MDLSSIMSDNLVDEFVSLQDVVPSLNSLFVCLGCSFFSLSLCISNLLTPDPLQMLQLRDFDVFSFADLLQFSSHSLLLRA